ncbi:NOP58 family protein [Candidatus Woesearchaeota archaeon]|nr:NOP58 family protein [Candidatus Woesearchaeota archaeon]
MSPVTHSPVSQKQLQELYYKNLTLTKEDLKKAVNEDQLIVQAIANITELDKVCNLLSKRLREWYGWYAPELSREVEDHQEFARLVAVGEKKKTESFGADLKKEDVQEMIFLAEEIMHLFALRKRHEEYLKIVMQEYCPNLLELSGATIAAHLLEMAKGLKHLALLPASTIQILGAEKALFRHIKTGSRSPKYGVLFQHPLVQKARAKERGKVARALADKLSLCARLDFFKGELKAGEYRKELEKKFEVKN